MSLQDATSWHDVMVFQELSTPQPDGTITHSWVPFGEPISCTVAPLPAEKVADFYIRGLKVSHKIYMHADPGPIHEGMELRWRYTVLKVKSPPVDVVGRGMMWIMYAEAHTIDNPGRTVIA